MQVLTVFREPLIKSHAVALLAKCGGLNQRFLITQHNVRCVIAQAVFINLGKTLMQT
jgi:hypothetical protein